VTDELVKELNGLAGDFGGVIGEKLTEAAALIAAQAAEIASVKEQLREALVEIMRRDDEEIPNIARLEHALLIERGKVERADEVAQQLMQERDALRTLLHSWRAHPDYEYTTTTGPRKAWWGSDDPPDGDGWVSNDAAGRNGWERFDYHEERYWMRRKPVTALAPAEQPKEGT
jgi:hypothetical protein